MVFIQPSRPHERKDEPQHSLFTTRYARQFTLLNNQQIAAGLIAKIRKLFGWLYSHVIGNNALKWQTHMFAEHLARGNLSGNLTSFATAKTIKLLGKLENPPADLIQALSYAQRLCEIDIAPKIIKQDIKNLAVGKSLAIPSSSSKHAMMLFITCTGIDESGKKIYKVVQHNQGAGIDNYHYRNVETDGKLRFQTALELLDVTEEHLCREGSSFINQLLDNDQHGSVENLYEKILPQLKGRLAPPSLDQRLWGHGQIGGSCSALCVLSIVRSQLDKASYKTFRDLGRVEALLKSYRQIKSGWGNNSTQITVTLEIVRSLQHSLKKRKLELPDLLKTMKKQLKPPKKVQATKTPKIQVGVRPPPPTQAPKAVWHQANTLQTALTRLTHGQFSIDTLEKVIPSLLDINPKTPTEIKRFIKVTTRFIDAHHKTPFTKEQIYVLTVASSLLAIATRKLRREHEILFSTKFLKKIGFFNFSMHAAYNGLGLSSYFTNAHFDSYITPYQKHYFEDELIIPEGLTFLQQQ